MCTEADVSQEVENEHIGKTIYKLITISKKKVKTEKTKKIQNG